MKCSSQQRRIQRGKEWLCRSVVFVVLLLSWGETHAQQKEVLSQRRQLEDKVVTIERFLLRLGPKQSDFSLKKKVTVLWTIENLVREYFESLYEGSSDTIFGGAGITGLSVVTPEEESPAYETVKFLGGAVTFDSDSLVTPTQSQLQIYIQDALDPDLVVQRLGVYFPTLDSAAFVPLALGNRGFGNDLTAPAQEEEEPGMSEEELYEKPVPKPVPEESETEAAGETAGNAHQEQVDAATTNSDLQANGIQASQATYDDGVDSTKTTVGLSTGVALGGAVILLLIALLVQSRQRRMEFWRECRDAKSGSLSLQDDIAKPNSGAASNMERYYMEEEQEPSLRLPRIWGVTPSGRMDAVTTPGSSDFSASNEGDSIQEILTCTSMDRRSIQNVESFEHQKRLVDTLKKEMMASNAEIHPYMQDTHLDNTEPCALSPTDLSAAALENDTSSRPVPTWHAPSDSSFTGSGSGSGYDSPTSPLRVMMRTLQMSASRHQAQSTSRRNASPYEADSVEL